MMDREQVLRELRDSAVEARTDMNSYFARTTQAAESAAKAAKILMSMLGTLDTLLEAIETEEPNLEENGEQAEATGSELSEPPADEETKTTRRQSHAITRRKEKGKAPAKEAGRRLAKEREVPKSSPAMGVRTTRKVQTPKISEEGRAKTSPRIHALGQHLNASGTSKKKPVSEAEWAKKAIKAVAAREAEKARGAGDKKAKSGKDGRLGTKWGHAEMIQESKSAGSEKAEGGAKRKSEALDSPQSEDGEVGEVEEVGEAEDEEGDEEEEEEVEVDFSDAPPPSKRSKTSAFTPVNARK